MQGEYGEKLQCSGGLSYSQWRELLHHKLRKLGFPPNSFGLHSLRDGRATATVMQVFTTSYLKDLIICQSTHIELKR